MNPLNYGGTPKKTPLVTVDSSLTGFGTEEEDDTLSRSHETEGVDFTSFLVACTFCIYKCHLGSFDRNL